MKAPEERFFILREPNVDWFWTGYGLSTDPKEAKKIGEQTLNALVAYYSQSEFHPMHIVTTKEISAQ